MQVFPFGIAKCCTDSNLLSLFVKFLLFLTSSFPWAELLEDDHGISRAQNKIAGLSCPGNPATSCSKRPVAFRPHLTMGLALSEHRMVLLLLVLWFCLCLGLVLRLSYYFIASNVIRRLKKITLLQKKI